MVIRKEDLLNASKKASLAGLVCQLSGALLATIAGAITTLAVSNGAGLYGFLGGGAITFGLALAGAPIAAIGSIANSQKASKELLYLYISEVTSQQSKPYPGAPAPPPPPVRG